MSGAAAADGAYDAEVALRRRPGGRRRRQDAARRGQQRAWAGDLVVYYVFGQGRLDMFLDGKIKMEVDVRA